ncbi:hypothetical protein ABZ128_27755 [Streptomyces sp. NPDC006326]|uniref:hypothetical protein n=1 Tax=Streptomyces sp. NPDC006326 TaxID=3156752 RepID=UPI0033B14BE7
MSTHAAPAAGASPWPTVARAVALLTVTISLLLTAFAWPSVRSSVHGVPIAVAGPAATLKRITPVLDQRLRDGFEITEAADTADTEQVVITASAGSTAVAQGLNGIATGLSQTDGSRTAVAARDLIPLPADDRLAIAATSLTIIGLVSLLGYVGFGLGAATHQLLPPGAGGQLLRFTAFFKGRGATPSATVLAMWLTLGLALCLAGKLRHRPTATVADPAATPAMPATVRPPQHLPSAGRARTTGNGAS